MDEDKTTEERLAAIETRLDRGDKRMGRIETSITENTGITVEVRDLLTALKGGLKVAGWIGHAAKWVGAVAIAGSAVWSLIYAAAHDGRLPK